MNPKLQEIKYSKRAGKMLPVIRLYKPRNSSKNKILPFRNSGGVLQFYCIDKEWRRAGTYNENLHIWALVIFGLSNRKGD